MEIVWVIAVIWGLAFAITEGTKRASRAVSGTYRKRVKAWVDRNPARPAPWGVKLGASVATALTGGALATRGFVEGVKVGWPEGKQRGRDWWEGRGATPVETGFPPDAPAEAAPVEPAPVPTPPAEVTELAARREPTPLRLIDSAPTTGGDMAVMTATGGEVVTMQQLIAELEGIKKEAAADLEDAQADRERAKEDANRIETMVASLRSVDMDTATVGEVGALADTAGQRLAAAEQRAAAADQRAAQADAALSGVQARHQLLAEAHASAPHAADKSFYTGG
jgi:hypothetical protein